MRHVAMTFAVCVASAFGAWMAVAAPIVEKHDRLEVNWATMRMRFFGQASADGNGEDGFRVAEKKAWQDGLNYVSDAVRNLNINVNEKLTENPDKLSEDAREAARLVSTSTYSYNTTYFGDGTVRVHLENSLPKAFESSGLRFRQKEALEPAMIPFTGIVFEADKSIKPTALYQVIDEHGEVLFSVQDMAEDAFRKNLMGRWFKKPSAAELSEAVGKNPLRLAAKADAPGKLVVPKDAWQKAIHGHQALLVNGSIAIAVP
jgi:hypothetical protein